MPGMTLIERFVRRLKRIGITVELAMNSPWVYITHVNGIAVDAKFKSNWGFTGFFVMKGEQWSDRREVFQMIRDALG